MLCKSRHGTIFSDYIINYIDNIISLIDIQYAEICSGISHDSSMMMRDSQ